MTFYEVAAYARDQNQSSAPGFTELGRVIALGGESSGATGGLSWSRELCSEGFITVSTRAENIPTGMKTRLLDMKNNPMELGLFRNGALRQRGPMVSWQVEGNSLVLQARGIPYYLRYMYLTVDKAYDQDQALIVKDLIDHHQAKTFGNFGIVTTGITSHGVIREREYLRTEMINIAKEIHALGEADNGFDVDINYTTRALILTNPQQGTDKSDTVFLDARGLINPNIAYSLAADKFASGAIGTGRTKDNTSVFSEIIDDPTTAAFGRSYVTANVFGVSSQTEIASYTTQAMSLARNPYFVPSREYMAVQGASVDDFDVGDTVSFVYDPGFGEITISQDVKNINVSVAPDGNEKLNVEFV